MDGLRQIAQDKNIRDARKLYQTARSQGQQVTMAQAAEALRNSVQRQVLGPKPRYLGHFTASRPGDEVQMDLVDFSKNTNPKLAGGHKYALLASDVFSRRMAIEPLKDKSSEKVHS